MKKIISAILAVFGFTFITAQAPQNWFNLDKKKDGYFGVSTEKAYKELLPAIKRVPVIVAVIDGGTDTAHEDLKNHLWTNSKEIPGNGIDDDHNGYADDIHGWSFLGGKDGDVSEETLEVTRLYAALKPKYENVSEDAVLPENKEEFRLYLEVKSKCKVQLSNSNSRIDLYSKLLEAVSDIRRLTGKEDPEVKDLKLITSDSKLINYTKDLFIKMMKGGMGFSSIVDQIKADQENQRKSIRSSYNIAFDARKLVGDNPEDYSQIYYGNNHITGPKGEHGTHVAGIIAADRNNSIGMNGVSDMAQIMVLRIVPDGDERDKDVANAIRYAVDNGAKVINMSFGKSYSPGKKYVDDAIRYAMSKDVVLVHAAGNDAQNTDEENNFPRACRENDSCKISWIEVGASSYEKRKEIPANFSNYGAKHVDVFAPGVSIYSTLPDNKYAYFNGTSMASPVVAGIAALIRSCYPQLSAAQVKQAIVSSTVPVKRKVYVPGKKNEKAKMKELCVTGGIANAYEALKAAQKMTLVNH